MLTYADHGLPYLQRALEELMPLDASYGIEVAAIAQQSRSLENALPRHPRIEDFEPLFVHFEAHEVGALARSKSALAPGDSAGTRGVDGRERHGFPQPQPSHPHDVRDGVVHIER